LISPSRSCPLVQGYGVAVEAEIQQGLEVYIPLGYQVWMAILLEYGACLWHKVYMSAKYIG
jgi:hypothetical protein